VPSECKESLLIQKEKENEAADAGGGLKVPASNSPSKWKNVEKNLSKASNKMLKKLSVVSKEELDIDAAHEVVEDMTKKIEQKSHIYFQQNLLSFAVLCLLKKNRIKF